MNFSRTRCSADHSFRSLVYHAWVTLYSTLLGFVFGTALGIVPRRRDRACEDTRPQPDAVDHFLADDPDPGDRADGYRRARGDRHHGPDPEGAISTYLSFFPVTVGMVKGPRSPEIMHST